jgi:hypothetical protein
MGSQERNRAGFRPWIEWFARRIDDPVARLKYLQVVSPLVLRARRRRWALPPLGLAAVVLLAVLGSFFLSRASGRVKTVVAATPKTQAREVAAAPLAQVWLVDNTVDSETYSNGLRIDTRFEAPNHPRSYLAFPVDRPDSVAGVRRNQPAGIVFHTTESRQAPLEADQNGALKRIGESVLDFVRRQHAYNFLIDRFGRVYRIVPEADAANHAGYSVWSDDVWFYLNLNESFLGVSFEAQTEPGQVEPSVSAAQVRAAAMLTEMLRGRYEIPPGNCVTHAQVSVNPDNMRVGYHTDWASSFPFAQLGLPDNYSRPLPALTAFGFEYDATFLRWAGTRLYAGVELAEEQLNRTAADNGVTLTALKTIHRKRYRLHLDEARRGNAASEESEGPALKQVP